MAWIETTAPEDAEGRLATLYRAIEGARGGVAAVHAVHSLHPKALQAHMRLYEAVVLSESALSRSMRERIAVLVSSRNRCAYCIAHHAEALRRLGEDESNVAALSNGHVPEGLPGREAALLTWASRGTVAPAELDESATAQLRQAGWTDREILDASLTTAYFNFVNRLVLMLGVQLEDGYEATCGPDGA